MSLCNEIPCRFIFSKSNNIWIAIHITIHINFFTFSSIDSSNICRYIIGCCNFILLHLQKKTASFANKYIHELHFHFVISLPFTKTFMMQLKYLACNRITNCKMFDRYFILLCVFISFYIILSHFTWCL